MRLKPVDALLALAALVVAVAIWYIANTDWFLW